MEIHKFLNKETQVFPELCSGGSADGPLPRGLGGDYFYPLIESKPCCGDKGKGFLSIQMIPEDATELMLGKP